MFSIRSLRLLSLALVAVMVAPERAQAQRFVPGVDVDVSTRYVWRGITRRNAWVLVPSWFAAGRWNDLFITGGGWTVMEFNETDPRLPEAVGLARKFGELSGWLEVSGALGPVDLAGGFVAYHFFDRAAATTVNDGVFNTKELYARARARIGPFTPGVAWWLDVDEVEGSYVELSGAYRLDVLPAGIPAVSFGALAGFSVGQEVPAGAPLRPGHFAERGFTHLDLSAGFQLALPLLPTNIYMTPSLHVQINEDPHTRITGGDPADRDHGVKVWGSLVLSVHL